MKVTINLRNDLLQRIDSTAERMSMSRSMFITMASVQYLRALTGNGCQDCYTCKHSDVGRNGLACEGLYNGLLIKNLALLGGVYPCPGWEKERKLVNERERTV